jgi:hypothetical protein
MRRKVSSHDRETKEVLRALRRAARVALELGIKTGTPVWVMKNNKMVDLTKDPRIRKKYELERFPTKKSPS